MCPAYPLSIPAVIWIKTPRAVGMPVNGDFEVTCIYWHSTAIIMHQDIPDTIPRILTGAVKVDSIRYLLYGVDELDVSQGP